MAKKVLLNDIVEKDVFNPLIENSKLLVSELDKVDAVFKDILDKSNQIAQTTPLKGYSNIKKVETSLGNAKKAIGGIQDVEKQRLILLNKIKQANSDRIQKNVELEEQLKIQKKRNRELAKEKLGLISAYQKESKRLIQLRNDYKNVALTQGSSSKEARKLSKEIKVLDRRLKEVDAAAGQFQRNVGNYGSAWKKAGTTLKGVFTTMGAGLTLFGAFRVVKNATGIIQDFEQANADLSAVLGVTSEQMEGLTEDALKYGETTVFTATQVSFLQKELAKLGFTQSEIRASTEAILELSAATGFDLANSAKLTGSALRAFNLEASEAQRVVDVFAKSTSSSALDMQFFETALSTVAPVANAFGFSIEETTALLGTLADSGFDASSAATATRNILLNLADANGTLAKELGGPVKNLGDLTAGLQSLRDRNIDLASALELTDKRSVAAFNTFIANTEAVDNLNDKLQNAGGTAEEMANKQLNTLEGALKLLNSAWEGFILRMNESTGISGILTNAVKFLAENLEDIIKAAFTAASTFLAYKTTMVAMNVATKAYGIATGIASTATALFSGNLKKATKSLNLFNKAARANLIGGIVAAVTAAITIFQLFGKEVDNTGDRIKDAVGKMNAKFLQEKQVLDTLFESIKNTTAGTKERTKAVNELQEKYPEYIGNINLEEASLYELEKAQNRATDALYNNLVAKLEATLIEKEYADVLEKQSQIITKNLANVQIQLEDYGVSSEEAFDKAQKATTKYFQLLNEGFDPKFAERQAAATAGILPYADAINSLSINTNQYLSNQNKLDLGLKQIRAVINSMKRDVGELSVEVEQGGKKYESTTKEIKKQAGAYEKLKKSISEQEKEIKNLVAAKDLDKTLTAEQIANSENEIKVKNALLEADKAQLIIIESQIQKLIEIDKLEKEARDRARERTDNLLKIREVQQGAIVDELNYQQEITTNSRKRLALIKDEYYIRRELLKERAAFELTNEKLTAEERILIQEKLKADLAKLKREETKELQENEKEQTENLKKELEKRGELIGTAITVIGEYWKKQSDKAIKELDRLIEASQQRSQQLTDIANKRNLTETESLAFEQEKQAKLQQQREKELRRQQQREFIVTAIQTYGQKVQAGSKNALGETVRDVTVLKEFVKNLPLFYEGTESVKNSLGSPDLPGQDGYIVRVDGDERIINPEHSKMMSGLSNETVANLSYLYKTNKLNHIPNNNLANSNSEIVNQLESLKQTIINEPKYLGRDFDKTAEAVVHTIKKGNKLVRNHKKLKGV